LQAITAVRKGANQFSMTINEMLSVDYNLRQYFQDFHKTIFLGCNNRGIVIKMKGHKIISLMEENKNVIKDSLLNINMSPKEGRKILLGNFSALHNLLKKNRIKNNNEDIYKFNKLMEIFTQLSQKQNTI